MSQVTDDEIKAIIDGCYGVTAGPIVRSLLTELLELRSKAPPAGGGEGKAVAWISEAEYARLTSAMTSGLYRIYPAPFKDSDAVPLYAVHPSSDSEKLIESLTKWFNRLPEVGKSEYDAMVAIIRETSNG